VLQAALDLSIGVLSTEENVRSFLELPSMSTDLLQATAATLLLQLLCWRLLRPTAVLGAQAIPSNIAVLEIDWNCTSSRLASQAVLAA
jgi:hypothetical protein